jgi:hypothetical protein
VTPSLRRRWNLPALAALTALATTSTLPFQWRFLCYCFASLPAVPRRPFSSGGRAAAPAAEVFPMQTSAISLAGAARAAALGSIALGLQVLLPACTLGICLNVDRGQDETLDRTDVWNYIDADGDGALSTDELLPLSADITSLSVGVLLTTSVLSTSTLGWRLRSLAASQTLRQRWQVTARAELRRIEAERAAAEGSVEQLSQGVLKRTKSDRDAERQIRSLEGELQELTEAGADEEADGPGDESTTVAAVGEIDDARGPPLKLKRSVSEKDRQRAVMLQVKHRSRLR